MYHLVVLDVDGTLLDSQHRLPPSIVSTLTDLRERGVRLTLATGKLAASLAMVRDACHLPGPFIACNGAVIMDGDLETVIQAETLSWDQWLLIRATLDACSPGMKVAWYTPHEIWLEDDSPALDAILAAYHETRVRHVPRFDQSMPLPVKILTYDTPERLDRLRTCAEARVGDRLQIVRTSIDFLEFMLPGINKGYALTNLLQRMAIATEDVIAIGDGENDMAMILLAGYGVAMGNAVPELRAVAREVIGTNDEAGVATFLMRVFAPATPQG